MTKFSDFPLDPQIITALDRMGFTEPTPIQKETLEIVLEGRDLIGLAETGSGKTAACAIPICQRVDPSKAGIQALILVPTRELALQYATEVQKIGKEKGVKSYALFGGEDYSLQRAKLKSGVQALVACPGRLIDLIYSRSIDLTQVGTLIMDEADEMMSMGFYDDMTFIIQCLVQDHQTLLFSATMPKEIKKLALEHMNDPKEVVLISKKATPTNIDHLFAYCSRAADRIDRLITLIEDARPKQSIIFCQSRLQVGEVCRALKRKIRDVDYLHGGLNQDIRAAITNKFRAQKIRHLVATDVASRGLDFSEITHVFNYALPMDDDTYVHRTGRTGRLGRSGVAISMVTDRDLHQLERILKRVGREPRWLGPEPDRTRARPPRPRQPRRGR